MEFILAMMVVFLAFAEIIILPFAGLVTVISLIVVGMRAIGILR